MTVPEIRGFQQNLLEMGVKEITYVGGEPFVNRHLGEVISDARIRGIRSAVVTNGTLLDDFMQIHGFYALPDVIILSLDGPQKIHDRIRGKRGTFRRATGSIAGIQKIRKKLERSSPMIFLYMTVSSANVRYVSEMFDIAQKLDVHALRFQTVSTIGREVADATNGIFQKEAVGFHSYDVDPALSLKQRHMNKIRDQLKGDAEWSKRTGITLMTEGILDAGGAPVTCRFIQQSMVVNPDGNVLPCPMMPGYIIGNVLNQSMEEIWGNESHRRFLSEFQRLSGFPVCSRCCVEKLSGDGDAVQ